MAPSPVNLKDFILSLKQAPTVPLPTSEEWKEHVERVSTPGRIAEVSEDQYAYWLDVLPPRWMRGSHFCFAEGAEPFRLFWRDGDRYFARPLTRDETVTFCRLAGIPLPD